MNDLRHRASLLIAPDGSAVPGVVYLVGAGPGAPDLITLRGWRLLQSCDVVVYDSLADARLHAELTCERINVGKRSGSHTLSQEEINALLVRLSKAGKRVVRLKGGDPFVLGRGSEEAAWLAEHGVSCLAIPGVSSSVAGPLLAGIPVTHRGLADAFCVVSAHPRGEDRSFTFPAYQPQLTVVVLMGVHALPRWQASLSALGYPANLPVAFVTWAGRPQQRTLRTTLANCAQAAEEFGLTAPTVAVVGRVAALNAVPAYNP
ncbi:MAG: uroporphyrinogen-III C-methyltransferase [Myxococcales bacterium]|nr:uroporphyrinogen-III C-methyltransferase [Myxococcales bacterium]